jgi:peptidoglycan/xylan/chitin deacetylase (PgdA/CDA1 family)
MPDAWWPGGARSAALVTVNFDAELFWLRLDPSVAERPKTRSMGEYGALRGAPRVLDALAAASVPSTWFVPEPIAKRYPDVVQRVADAGHEIACRSDPEREPIESCAATLESLTGRRPVGFRAFDDITGETGDVLASLGFEWCSTTRGDDRPSFVETPAGPTRLVEIAYHWELQDAPFFLFNYGPAYPPGQSRIASYARVLDDWKRQFDAYHAAGLCFVLTLDPQAIGSPGKIGILEELLGYMRGREDLWFATGAQIADRWREVGPPNEPDNSERVRFGSLP